MTNSPTELHVFKDANDFFDAKHDIFTEEYLDKCIMGGDALNHTPMNEVSFVHKDSGDSVFSSRILHGIINNHPLIRVVSESIAESKVIIEIYYLNNYEDIEDFFCLKSIYDFLVEGVMIYQIFTVNIKSLDMINDFWLTSEIDTCLW